MNKKIQVGDRVRLKAAFLRSIGAYYGEVPHAKGTVTAINEYGHNRTAVAKVDWNDGEGPKGSLVSNLERCK